MFVLLFLLAGSAGLLYIPKFRIQKIPVSGNETLGAQEIISGVSDSLKGFRFVILPRDNILILAKEEISNSLLSAFPRVKNVSLDRNFPDSLAVTIIERRPAALFCNGEDCRFIDEDGFIFDEAASFSGNVYVKFYSEIGEAEIGTINNFKRIMDFANLVLEENIKITDIVLAEEGLRKFFTSDGWHILLNENDNIQAAFENLKLTLGQIKENRQNLEYIDLRFGNKVYYKFK